MGSKTQETLKQEIEANLSGEEKEVYEKLFHEADKENIGVLLGEHSISFFEKTGLSSQILGEIWKIADDENMGFLTQKKFNIALRLIAHAQEGRHPSLDLINSKCPLPKFNIEKAINWNTPSQVLDVIPLITIEERNRYQNIFKNLKLTNGLVKGSRAKTIFLRTHLPNEILGQIWNLVDIQRRGALNITEFTVAMHLIHSLINGSLKTLPSILSPEVFNMVAGKIHSREPSQRTVFNDLSPKNSINLKLEDLNDFSQKYNKHQHITSQSNIFSQFDSNVTNDWNIKPHEKSQYINLFRSISKSNYDYVTGDEAVSFFLSSKLPEETLAHIWDLADIDKSGKLNTEEFIIAMHLIRQKLAGTDLPTSLPQELILSLLQKDFPQENAFFFPSCNQDPSSSTTSESFDLNNSFSSQAHITSPSVPSSVFSIKHSTDSYIETPKVISSPSHAFSITSHSRAPSIRSVHKTPFIPTSNFGQSIVSSTTSNPKILHHKSSTMIDLLSDTNTEDSEKNEAMANESDNAYNRILLLSKQIKELKQTHVSIKSDLNTVNTQKRDIEERLSQIHILYNKELKIIQKIQEHFTESQISKEKLKQKCLVLEKKLYALQDQKQKQLQDLKYSTNENIELEKKIKSMSSQIFALEEDLEKIGKSISDQKNMTVINKKQLSAFEDNYAQLKISIKENTKVQNVLKDTNSSFILSPNNQLSNPFHQISNFNEMKSVSPMFIPICDNSNIIDQSDIHNNSIKNFNETVCNKELKESSDIINNQHIDMKQNHQLPGSCNSGIPSLITSVSFAENIIQKDLSSNIDMQVLKRKNSLTESLDSSVIVQPPESTPGKLSRVSSYPGTPTPWVINKNNSPKTEDESYLDFEPDHIFLKDPAMKKLEFYKENIFNNLKTTDVLIHSKEISKELLHNAESKKVIFNMKNLNKALLDSSETEKNNLLNTNLKSNDTLHKKNDIEYLGVQNITAQEENITGTLPGTFPIDFDNQIINNKNTYRTLNKIEDEKNNGINNKAESAIFDPFLSNNNNNNNNNMSKKNKADFDEAFTNLVAEPENSSNDDSFISKFPPINSFYSSSESADIDDFNNDSNAYLKNKDLISNIPVLNSDHNPSCNTKITTINEEDTIDSNVDNISRNIFKKKQSKKLLLDINEFSENVQASNITLHSENTEEKNENRSYGLITEELNSFENDFCIQNYELNTFFTEPFSKEAKNN
ncbi:hypothetical protein PMAC_002548 [Pneumocystis sp. 'macacae']|nr:hypothetical protein PMAC_002548 [Pneumocystis sp. 'macacae']